MTEEPSTDIALRVNGEEHRLSASARATLAEVLREQLRLTGTHLGCEHGVCGSCTVLLDGDAVRSCLIFAVQLDATNHEITTIEGLGTPDDLHVVQQAFLDAMSFQCGFCTPGIVCASVAWLEDWRAQGCPTLQENDLRVALAGNLCRCTGYQSIIDGLALAAERMTATEDEAGGGSSA